MTEFKPEILESLRQPLEDKKVTVVRMNNAYTFPADFMLAGAINPCKCGYFPDRNRCNCSETDIKRYIGRISNPIWDRLDICIRTEQIQYNDFISEKDDKTLSSNDLKILVDKARKIQLKRFIKSKINFNSEMSVNDVKKYCVLGGEEESFMRKLYDKNNLTARGYHKILKTARTIADIDESEDIKACHLAEACMYRDIPETGGAF